MRILIVIYSLDGGGAERVTANLARLWANRGDKVTVATLSSAAATYQLEPGIEIVDLNLAKLSEGIGDALLNNICRVSAIRALIRRLTPDVTIGIMTAANVLVALAAIGLATRTVGAERLYPPDLNAGLWWALARKYVYGLLGRVIAQTRAASVWLEANTTARCVATIPNAVEWPLSESGRSISPSSILRPGRKLILAAGRLDSQKGFDLLIRAFAALRGDHRDWDVVILGEGPERSALEACIDGAGLAAMVFLPGRVGNMADWYQRAAIFCFSSLSEGFPNVLLEAMAAGVPVISFDCNAGPRDIIRDGIDGLLVPLGDERRLAEAMRSLMEDEKVRVQMGVRAVEVRERFSADRVLTLWDKAFDFTWPAGAQRSP